MVRSAIVSGSICLAQCGDTLGLVDLEIISIKAIKIATGHIAKVGKAPWESEIKNVGTWGGIVVARYGSLLSEHMDIDEGRGSIRCAEDLEVNCIRNTDRFPGSTFQDVLVCIAPVIIVVEVGGSPIACLVKGSAGIIDSPNDTISGSRRSSGNSSTSHVCRIP